MRAFEAERMRMHYCTCTCSYRVPVLGSAVFQLYLMKEGQHMAFGALSGLLHPPLFLFLFSRGVLSASASISPVALLMDFMRKRSSMFTCSLYILYIHYFQIDFHFILFILGFSGYPGFPRFSGFPEFPGFPGFSEFSKIFCFLVNPHFILFKIMFAGNGQSIHHLNHNTTFKCGVCKRTSPSTW